MNPTVVGTHVAVAAATSVMSAILAFAAAGLACSAMLPLSLGIVGREFPRLGATSSGELVAGYQVGYGFTAFGVAPLIAATGRAMSEIYLAGPGVAVLLVLVARFGTARRSIQISTTIQQPATPDGKK